MTDTKQESRREIAEAFVEKWPVFASPVDAVELLLKCRDERAAKIGDKYIADMRSVKQRTEYGEGCLNAAIYITAAIRNGDANA